MNINTYTAIYDLESSDHINRRPLTRVQYTHV